MMMLKVICLMVMMMVMVFTPDICHNHHNHWLCKTSVKFSDWNAKLLTHSVKHFTHNLSQVNFCREFTHFQVYNFLA